MLGGFDLLHNETASIPDPCFYLLLSATATKSYHAVLVLYDIHMFILQSCLKHFMNPRSRHTSHNQQWNVTSVIQSMGVVTCHIDKLNIPLKQTSHFLLFAKVIQKQKLVLWIPTYPSKQKIFIQDRKCWQTFMSNLTQSNKAIMEAVFSNQQGNIEYQQIKDIVKVKQALILKC